MLLLSGGAEVEQRLLDTRRGDVVQGGLDDCEVRPLSSGRLGGARVPADDEPALVAALDNERDAGVLLQQEESEGGGGRRDCCDDV